MITKLQITLQAVEELMNARRHWASTHHLFKFVKRNMPNLYRHVYPHMPHAYLICGTFTLDDECTIQHIKRIPTQGGCMGTAHINAKTFSKHTVKWMKRGHIICGIAKVGSHVCPDGIIVELSRLSDNTITLLLQLYSNTPRLIIYNSQQREIKATLI